MKIHHAVRTLHVHTHICMYELCMYMRTRAGRSRSGWMRRRRSAFTRFAHLLPFSPFSRDRSDRCHRLTPRSGMSTPTDVHICMCNMYVCMYVCICSYGGPAAAAVTSHICGTSAALIHIHPSIHIHIHIPYASQTSRSHTPRARARHILYIHVDGIRGRNLARAIALRYNTYGGARGELSNEIQSQSDLSETDRSYAGVWVWVWGVVCGEE